MPEVTCGDCGYVVGPRFANPESPSLVGSTIPPKNNVPARLCGFIPRQDTWRDNYSRAREVGVPEAVLARAAYVYQKASKDDLLHILRRWRHTLALCCIYLAARERQYWLPEEWMRYWKTSKSSAYTRCRAFMFRVLPYFTPEARVKRFAPTLALAYRLLRANPTRHYTTRQIAGAIGKPADKVIAKLRDCIRGRQRLNPHVRYCIRQGLSTLGKPYVTQREFWWEP